MTLKSEGPVFTCLKSIFRISENVAYASHLVGLWSVNETGQQFCDVPVLSAQVKPVESARDLGVIIDSQLSLSAHVAALCRSCYYQLRQLRPEIQSLTSDAAKNLVQSFITCRLDYCNSLLFGVFNYRTPSHV